MPIAVATVASHCLHLQCCRFGEITKCWDENPKNRPTFTELKEFLEHCLVNDVHKFRQDNITEEAKGNLCCYINTFASSTSRVFV